MVHWFAKRLSEVRKEEAGFTLVELLVVCIIIGVLAAIAIPAFLEQREASWTAACRSDARNGAAAATAFAADNNGSYTGMVLNDGAGGTNGLQDDYGWRMSPNVTGAVNVPAGGASFTLTATHGLLPAGANVCTFNSAVGSVTGP